MSRELIIDWAEAKMRSGGNEALAKEMFELFCSKLAEEKHKLANAFKKTEQQEYETLQQVIHKFHGALLYCGLPRLQKAACELETALKKMELDKISPLYENLCQEIETLIAVQAEE